MNSILIRLTFLCSIFIYSCTPIYVPNVRSVFPFERRGEFHGKVYFDPLKYAFEKSTLVDVQSGVSITNNIAVIGNYMQSHNSRLQGSYPYSIHVKYKEVGAGYYRNFKKGMHAEFFAGYGVGYVKTIDIFNSLSKDDQPLKLNYERYFLQGAFVIKRKIITLAPTVRLSQVVFTKYEKPSGARNFNDGGNFFVEPGFSAILSKRDSKSLFLSHTSFNVQVGFSCSRLFEGQYKFSQEYGYSPFTTSIGLGFRLGPLGGNGPK